MSEWLPIESAPKDCDEPFLVYAMWDWGGMCGYDVDEDYETRVATEYSGVFYSVTSNPYKDHAFKPTHWMPLPSPPK